MTSTFPSSIVAILDLPEPTSLDATFVYNFFTPDERLDESGQGFHATAATREQILLASGDIPRFVKLTWKPAIVQNPLNGPSGGGTRFKSSDIFNARTVGFVQSEQVFSNFNFVGFNFQDLGMDYKLFKQASGSINLRGISESYLGDAAKKLASQVRGSVDKDVLTEVMSDHTKKGLIFRKTGLQKQVKKDTFESLDSLSVRVQVNNKVVGTVVTNATDDSLNSYHNKMSLFTKSADAIQKESVATKIPFSVSSKEWDTGFVPLITQPLNPNDDGADLSGCVGVGYIVEKEFLDQRGRVRGRSYVIVNGSNSTTIIDPEVKYGGSYRYKVKTVAVMTLPGANELGEMALARGLVSSLPCSAIGIKCVEHEPPPPPSDFKPTWDYTGRSLRLLWSFPVNHQRDVKYFQVFRRSSVDEPFSLLAMYDFNDVLGPVKLSENPDPSLVAKMVNPITFYIDPEFTKDSSFIYSLCCVDAHGFTSNMSTQFQVTFDRFSNKIVLKTISRAGAPKAYPNIYVQEDAFVDVMRTSAFERMTVYFDPDHLKITDSQDRDLGFLPLDDPNSLFKILLVNTDQQESETIDVKLDDRRHKVKKPKERPKRPKLRNALAAFTGLRPRR